MSKLVSPHGGGELKPLLSPKVERASEMERAGSLKKVPMTSKETSDVLMFAMGAYTPLDGFMGKADWKGVCADMKMKDGLFWPIPITLSTDNATAESIKEGQEVALVDEDGEIMGAMTVTEKYSIDKAHECRTVFKTTDVAHPGVKMVMEQGDVNLAGPVKVFSQGEFPTKYADTYMTPAQTRAMFDAKGWKTVARVCAGVI